MRGLDAGYFIEDSNELYQPYPEVMPQQFQGGEHKEEEGEVF